MFDLTKDPAGFYRLTIQGKIEEAEMRAGLDAFLAAVEDGGPADFLYTISDFELPSLQAIIVEFGYMPMLIGSITKIRNVAVVADQDWLRKAAEIEGMMLPGVTIKTFELDDEAGALAWLTA